MSTPTIQKPFLPPNTVVPTSWDLFVPYFNRIYEEMAFVVNSKSILYTMSITDTPQDIINIQNGVSATPSTNGGFLICVSGYQNGMPTLNAALAKSAAGIAGVVTVLNFQAGNIAPWAAATLTITSTATNFQIAHSVPAQAGNFNIRIIGTQ